MIASIINITDLNYDTPFKYASSVLSIVILVILAFAIGFEINVIRTHKGKYHLEEFKLKYSAIIDGLDSNTIAGRYWNPLNLIRWALTITIMIFLNQHNAAQILVLLVVSVIFQIIIVISNPMTEKRDQRITWIIEISVSIYLYVLLCLTDFMGENTKRD
jgi:Na+/melibiose symporter-like transporter